MEVDGVSGNSGLYFQAAQAAQAEQAREKEKSRRLSKIPFAEVLKKSHEELELQESGLPKEIAGMAPEDAVVYLKDAADIAADKLKAKQLPENFAVYRQKVSQFMRYIVKNNFVLKEHLRFRSNPKRLLSKPNPYIQVAIVNQKLDDMARWLISSHHTTLGLLARVDEINGLLVDMLAM